MTSEQDRHLVTVVVILALLLAVGVGITVADALGIFSIYDL